MSTVRLEVAHLRELFDEPDFDPLAGQVEHVAGVERVMDQLEGVKTSGHILEIVVPTPTHSPEQVQAAIGEFCRAERFEAERMVRLTRKRGREALWIGLPVLAVCLGLSGVASGWSNSAAGGLLSNSFVIAGWVAMWRPAELLLYDWWPYAHRAKLLDRLAGMEVRVVGQ